MLYAPHITIRDANPSDAAAVAALGERFHVEAGWDDIADYDADDCRVFLEELAQNPDAVFLVAEREGEIVGMAAGLAMPLYFNVRHRHGQELFFWLDPSARGHIGSAFLQAFEDAARGIGCASWAMVALAKVKPELTGRLYSRKGYRASEHYWIRRL